jgi:signal transduction histidine kinase
MIKIGPMISCHSIMILLHDISAIRNYQKEAYKYLYLSTSNHELKTPLNPILNAFDMIELSATEEQRKYIKVGRRSLKMLTLTIDNSIV